MKLWHSKTRLDPLIERFTAGDDRRWDALLLPYDLAGTRGHVAGLRRIGILTPAEFRRLDAALASLARQARSGRLRLGPRDEDCHTAIERWLTGRLGPLGQKVHTGRSRNDQVQCALRLWAKEHLARLANAALITAGRLLAFARRHARVPMPGFTHTRKAMPTTVGHWAAAQAEGILDSLGLLEAAWTLADESPLGSAAGYGVPLPLDREFVARRLGFARVQNNTLAVQNRRGILEAAALSAAAILLSQISRFAADVIAWTGEEFGFLTLDGSVVTGSSIMPQKKNPDPLELLRARAARLAADAAAVLSIPARLTSGYHRDLQETKGVFLQGILSAEECAAVAGRVVEGLGVNAVRCRLACTPDLFAADAALAAAAGGVPFREAYRATAAGLDELPPVRHLLRAVAARRSLGAPGRPGLEIARRRLNAALRLWGERQRQVAGVLRP